MLCECMYVCTYVWRSELAVRCLFVSRGLPLSLEFTDWLGCLVSELQGSDRSPLRDRAIEVSHAGVSGFVSMLGTVTHARAAGVY